MKLNKTASVSGSKPKTLRPIYRRDALFKALVVLRPIYIGLLKKHLPQHFLKLVDLQQAQLINTSTVNSSLRERLADVVIQVPFLSGNGVLIVGIEQQTRRIFTPERALSYQVRILRTARRANPNINAVAVCTIVLFSDSMSENQTVDVFAGLNAQEQQAAREALGAIYPVELANISDKQLQGSMAGVLEMLLKHRRGTRMLPLLQTLMPQIQTFQQGPQGQEFVDTCLTYVLLAAREDERHGIIQLIGENLGDQEEKSIMTVANALKREGRQEGRQEGEKIGVQKGRQEGLERAAVGMLQEGMAMEMVRKITHLSKQRIEKLLTKLEHKIGKGRL